MVGQVINESKDVLPNQKVLIGGRNFFCLPIPDQIIRRGALFEMRVDHYFFGGFKFENYFLSDKTVKGSALVKRLENSVNSQYFQCSVVVECVYFEWMPYSDVRSGDLFGVQIGARFDGHGGGFSLLSNRFILEVVDSSLDWDGKVVG